MLAAPDRPSKDQNRTIPVLSGGTRADHLTRYAYRPDRVVESLAELSVEELLGLELAA